MSIHTEPVRRYDEHHFTTPTVTEVRCDPFDHNDPLFMSVQCAAEDAMVEALIEDLDVDLAIQAIIDDVDANGLAFGG